MTWIRLCSIFIFHSSPLVMIWLITFLFNRDWFCCCCSRFVLAVARNLLVFAVLDHALVYQDLLLFSFWAADSIAFEVFVYLFHLNSDPCNGHDTSFVSLSLCSCDSSSVLAIWSFGLFLRFGLFSSWWYFPSLVQIIVCDILSRIGYDLLACCGFVFASVLMVKFQIWLLSWWLSMD